MYLKRVMFFLPHILITAEVGKVAFFFLANVLLRHSVYELRRNLFVFLTPRNG